MITIEQARQLTEASRTAQTKEAIDYIEQEIRDACLSGAHILRIRHSDIAYMEIENLRTIFQGFRIEFDNIANPYYIIIKW